MIAKAAESRVPLREEYGARRGRTRVGGVKSPVKGSRGSIRGMTRAGIVVKQWRSERFARKRRAGRFVGQFLEKIVRLPKRRSADSQFV